nr:YegP family protein [Eubacterium sp.]
KANNGEVIATSQVYKSLVYCKKGIASVQKNAPDAPVEDQTIEGYAKEKNPKFEIYKDKKGEYRFRLKAGNGQIIATGEGYKELKSCKNGINSIKKNAPAAKIVEE